MASAQLHRRARSEQGRVPLLACLQVHDRLASLLHRRHDGQPSERDRDDSRLGAQLLERRVRRVHEPAATATPRSRNTSSGVSSVIRNRRISVAPITTSSAVGTAKTSAPTILWGTARRRFRARGRRSRATSGGRARLSMAMPMATGRVPRRRAGDRPERDDGDDGEDICGEPGQDAHERATQVDLLNTAAPRRQRLNPRSCARGTAGSKTLFGGARKELADACGGSCDPGLSPRRRDRRRRWWPGGGAHAAPRPEPGPARGSWIGRAAQTRHA